MMSLNEQLFTILIVIFALQICRWLPFWVFPEHKPIPAFVQYLGKALPPAVFGLLVIYCYKNVNLFAEYYGLAEFIAGGVVVALHLWKKNMFLSIATGTILYMYLVQNVFV